MTSTKPVGKFERVLVEWLSLYSRDNKALSMIRL
ncbi:hypothetical protein BD65_1570 [Yersinia ruckeri]|nr:hypothetical protein BD65_1570 [Yersinia ruckeri]